PEVATITHSGLVQALHEGTTVITATYGYYEPVTYQLVVHTADPIDTIRAHIDLYTTEGGMNTVLADQLRYRLDIIELLSSQGNWAIAVAYMQDFLNYILDPSVQAQQLISPDATAAIEDMAQLWIQLASKL